MSGMIAEINVFSVILIQYDRPIARNSCNNLLSSCSEGARVSWALGFVRTAGTSCDDKPTLMCSWLTWRYLLTVTLKYPHYHTVASLHGVFSCSSLSPPPTETSARLAPHPGGAIHARSFDSNMDSGQSLSYGWGYRLAA